MLFERVADGRMSVTTILTLGTRLPCPDADRLIEECSGRSRSEIEWLLAQRFPRPEMFEWGTSAAPTAQAMSGNEPAPGRLDPMISSVSRSIPVPSKQDAKFTPLAEERVALQVTISRETQRKLERAKELLGHEVGKGDAAAILDRALDALVTELEKRKRGKHTRHRAGRAPAVDSPRYVPATHQAPSTAPAPTRTPS